jgi:hypothetical protein
MIRRDLILVFVFALAARLFFVQQALGDPERYLQRPDSRSYLAPASGLAQGKGFTLPDGRPDALRGPGYPLFLAAHRALTPNLLFPALTQCLLDSASAVFVSLIAVTLTVHPLASMAGMVYALDPAAAAQAPLILSETCFTFLLISSVWLGLLGSPLAGLFCGLGALTRPPALFLWVPWCLAWGRRFWLFALLAAVPTTIWCARNYARFGAFEMTSMTGIHLLLWEASAVKGAAEGLATEEARRRLVVEEPESETEKDTPFARSARQSKKAFEIMSANPAAVLKVHALSTAKMLIAPGLEGVAQGIDPELALPTARSVEDKILGAGAGALLRERPKLWISLGWSLLLLACVYPLALLGSWKLGRQGLHLVLPLLYLILVSGGGWAYYGLRLPMMPLLAVLAACGLGRNRV